MKEYSYITKINISYEVWFQLHKKMAFLFKGTCTLSKLYKWLHVFNDKKIF